MHTETTSPQESSLNPANAPISPGGTSIAATAPGQLRVIKRNGTVVPYDDSKIAVAMTKAFLAVEGGTAAASSRIHETVANLTRQIDQIFRRRMPSGGTVHIEDIQDQVELALMRSSEQKVARDYVLYREEHARLRAAKAQAESKPHPTINVTMPDGSRQPLDVGRLETVVREACVELEGVDANTIIEEAMRNLYDGVSLDDVNTSLVITARALVEKEPNYSYATARLLMDQLRAEGLSFLGITQQATQSEMAALYPRALPVYIHKAIELELVSPELATMTWKSWVAH
jgi:ribonucleoside-diphosphate reductase alpha chain